MAAHLERLHSPDDAGVLDPYAIVGEIVSGRFRVLAMKHAGPRQIVYEVEPPGVGHLRRALKVITVAEAREPGVAERLRTVARAIREIEATQIEHVFDVGFLPDESPFLITEWLPHVTLERHLSGRRRLPAATSLEILAEIVRGCAELHLRGVIHGDIRPNHVLLELLGEEPQDIRTVKLTDAGVPGVLNMSPQGGAHGQVAYLAPECQAGQARSPASDVYALGVLAYRLLTLSLPYRAEDPRAATQDRDPVARVRWLHQNASPVRPSRLVHPVDFAPEVEAVIGRAMAKSLVERFPDAIAFLVALEAAMRQPAHREPGAVALPLSDDLPTEDLLDEPPTNPLPSPAADDVVIETPSESPEPSESGAAPIDAAPAASAPAVLASAPASAIASEQSPVPSSPPLWMWAVAGVATGVVLALVF